MIDVVFPDFDLASTGNKAIHLSSSAGKILITHFHQNGSAAGRTIKADACSLSYHD